MRQIRAERGRQVVLDVPDRHPARIQADDHVIEPAQAPLPLRNQAWSERAGTVTGDVQRDRPDLGLNRLRRRPITRVGVLRRVPGALLVAEMAAQLRLQAPFQRGLDQRRHEPTIPVSSTSPASI